MSPRSRFCATFLVLGLLAGCGAGRDGLLDQAESDLDCDEDELIVSQTRSATLDDGAGSRFEVEGCERRAEYEKKAHLVWIRVDERKPKRVVGTRASKPTVEPK
jgi:hypothetical protein